MGQTPLTTHVGLLVWSQVCNVFLIVSDIESFVVSHCKPNTLMGPGSAAVLSLFTCSTKRLLFDAQLLRLKLASFMIALAAW